MSASSKASSFGLNPPPLSPRVTAAPRITRLLRRVIAEGGLVVVSASIGAGKSSNVAAAVRELGRPATWIRAGESDRVSVSEAATLVPAGGILVVDDLDLLDARSPEWRSVAALGRLSATGRSVVLIGRQPLPFHLIDPHCTERMTVVDDDDLALTASEACRILGTGVDASHVRDRVDHLAGWATGVLRLPRRGAEPPMTPDLERASARHTILQLPGPLRHFLVTTAPMLEMDLPRSIKLGFRGAEDLMGALRTLHLPLRWTGLDSFRCHPSFRAALLAEFDQLSQADGLDGYATRDSLQRGASLLMRALCAGDLDELGVILGQIGTRNPAGLPLTVLIAGMVAGAAESRWDRAADYADHIMRSGRLDETIRLSPYSVQLMLRCYDYVARFDDVEVVLERVTVVDSTAAAQRARRFLASSWLEEGDTTSPPDDIHGFTLASLFRSGEWETASTRPTARVSRRYAAFWRVAALRVTGRTQSALHAYRQLERSPQSLWMTCYIVPDLLLDAELGDDAREVAEAGAEHARSVGAVHFELLALVQLAKIAVHQRDSDRARGVLAHVYGDGRLHHYPALDEAAGLWRAASLMLDGDWAPARDILHDTVDAMRKRHHFVDLSTAAVYLAEAQWRCGDADAADAASRVFMEVSSRLGSSHLALQALRDYPAVAARWLDQAGEHGRFWHELTQPLEAAPRTARTASPSVHLHLRDLGSPELAINGRAIRLRVRRCYELLSLLSLQPGMRATRERLLDALFEGEDSATTRSHLRQCLHWLQSALPPGTIHAEPDHIEIDTAAEVTTDSGLFDHRIKEAGRTHGRRRIGLLKQALEAGEEPYLFWATSDWVEERRTLMATTRMDAAVALALHQYDDGQLLDARATIEGVLARDPLRESGWQLLMRIAHELHDRDRVRSTYLRCRRALEQSGLSPSESTRGLFSTLSTNTVVHQVVTP